MAKIEYIHSCGHPGVPGGRLSSASDERYWSKRIGAEPCPACKRAAKDAASRQIAEDAGLLPLTGSSERQIAYGETMRARHLAALPAHVARLRTIGSDLHLDAAAQAELDDAIVLVMSEVRAWTAAKAWIEFPTAFVAWAMDEIVRRTLAPGAVIGLDDADYDDARRAIETPDGGLSPQESAAALRVLESDDQIDTRVMSQQRPYGSASDVALVRAALDRLAA